jgi:maltose alpha-D-glucosyltransferase / alpha-amylase
LSLMPSIDVIEPAVLELNVQEFWNDPETRETFERVVLPRFLAHARWYPEHSESAIDVEVVSVFPGSNTNDSLTWLAILKTLGREPTQLYLLPMQIDWTCSDQQHPRVIAVVSQGPRKGVLLDVASSADFITGLLTNLRRSAIIGTDGRFLEFKPTGVFERTHIDESDIRAVSAEQSNSTTLVDHSCVVKIYRKLDQGINPEIEVGHFLTEVAGFANTPALFGSIELSQDGQRSAVGVVHGFVPNQGDAWNRTAAYLDNFVASQRGLPEEQNHYLSDEEIAYLAYMNRTGRRVGEMHLALSSSPDMADFAPELTKSEDVRRWSADILARAYRVFDTLRRSSTSAADSKFLGQFIACERTLETRLEQFLPADISCMNIRHHGDFHLGQMLVARDDIFIIDFEGEPNRPHAERRLKAPAARDVAGFIRSLDYSVGAAFERAVKNTSDQDGTLASLAAWRANATAAFLGAYWQTVENANIWPRERAAADAMLKFFLVEKAFYEVEYELAYRPHWLRIPLSGIVRILSEF